jgi:hypothetical protein
MKNIFNIMLFVIAFSISSNAQEAAAKKSSCCSSNSKDSKMAANNESASACATTCEAKNKNTVMACKLTSPELQKRKATILASLKQQIIEKKELPSGYAYKFSGADKVVDELAEFIKTERECCDFFTFNLSVSGDKSEAWLELKGPEGVKDFIKSELGL